MLSDFYAMKKSSPAELKLIYTAIKSDGIDQIDEIQAIIESTGALQYTADYARKVANSAIAAISSLPDSIYKQALIAIAEFSVHRRS